MYFWLDKSTEGIILQNKPGGKNSFVTLEIKEEPRYLSYIKADY